MDLGVGPDRRPGVEVDGLGAIGAQFGCDLESLIEESLAFAVVVVREDTDVVEPAFPRSNVLMIRSGVEWTSV